MPSPKARHGGIETLSDKQRSNGGTVGLVCIEEGRSFLGVELKPEYCDISRRRLDDRLGLFGRCEVMG